MLKPSEETAQPAGEDAPRPAPLIDLATAAFWTGGADGQLLIARCQVCRYYVHPPVRFCPRCEATDVVPEAVSGRAVVTTFTVNHKAWRRGLPNRYVVALVTLAEQADVQLPTNIVNCGPDDVRFGMAVRVTFEERQGAWIPLFEPDDRP